MTLFDKPFALNIGPQRSGTTWIHNYLDSRGDVCLPSHVKEIFFFDRYHNKGGAFYKRHFDPKPHHDLVMEVSATTFNVPEGPEHVRALFGTDIKLICPLRHPISRSYSLYRHLKQYGLVTGTLDEAIQQRPEIVLSSFYATHLQQWYNVFPKENITILFLEELQYDPDSFVKKLCSGLDIPYKPAAEKFRKEKTNYAVKPPSVRLARTGQNLADLLRQNGLYSIINFAKSLGLKRLFFGTGKKSKDTLLTLMERELLHKHLSDQAPILEEFLGYKVPWWHNNNPITEDLENKNG